MPAETRDATGLAGRYATALFELAETGKRLDAVADDLRSLRAMMAESADLRRAILSPGISRHDHIKALGALAQEAGMDDLTGRFLGLIASSRRLGALDGMIASYLALLAQHRGEITAEVTSATELSAKHTNEVAAALKAAMGQTVTVDARIDASLLGGLIVKVGSKMIDTSLRTKLLKLQLAMKGIG